MPDELTIDRAHAALLIMDYQTNILANVPADRDAILARAARVLEAARGARVPVIYVTVAFRPGYPEVSPRNVLFFAIRGSGRLVAGAPGTEVHASVAPREGELVVTKRRVSAFAGSDLDLILRAQGIETLILFGVSTSGVVLSTVRHAADADFRLIVVGDCCADADAEVHRVLVEKILARQAKVVGAEALAAALRVGG